MDNQPSVNRELLIPVFIGGFSIIGIVVVLLIGRALSSPAQVATTPSATPFQYIYLGTEPAISSPFAFTEISQVAPEMEVTVVAGPTDDVETPFATSAPTSSISTPLILQTPTTQGGPSGGEGPPGAVVRTATPDAGTSTPGNIYDDTDPRLEYAGNWTPQTNVSGAHEGTLHVSTTRGDTVTFTFTGTEIHFFYQAGSSLGSVAVTIDGLGSPPFSQTQGNRWSSGPLAQGTHSIVIEHFDGGSVNIDSLMIPAVAVTLTPSASPTVTPTQ